MSGTVPNDISGPPSSETLNHLDDILRSPSFASSKRCQEFLRYVVRETVEGRAHSIKERVIAQEVFGRGVHFEPGEDSLVRVKAREVRKRLAEYYNSAPDSTLKIELPLGGYVPRIQPSVKQVPPAVVVIEPVAVKDKSSLSRRRLFWMIGGSAGALGAAAILPPLLARRSVSDLFWRPVFATKRPLLIFVPVLMNNGELTDRVGLGTAVAVSSAADFLTKHGCPYHLRFGADLTFSQLREQPSLLLGGFTSDWTLRLTRGLRFNLVRNASGPGGGVLDTHTKQLWGPIVPHNGYADQDYAIVCRLFDANSGQIVLIAAGVTTFGTASAAAVFFDTELLAKLVSQAPAHWDSKNFQAVIHISIIGATSSSPDFVSTYFW